MTLKRRFLEILHLTVINIRNWDKRITYANFLKKSEVKSRQKGCVGMISYFYIN